MNNQPLLEFLIPAYKRFDGVVKAAVSIASQIYANSLVGIVSIRIVDDASPGFSSQHLSEKLVCYKDVISLSFNKINKGMSLNIFDMVESSQSQFCTVLTDDDWLFPGSLVEIVNYLEHLVGRPEVGGVFTPRYSYLEDGSLHCVACQPFKRDKLLSPGPINSLRYCHNGFILTGFIFRTTFFAKDAWKENIQNGYFPVINFWGILRKSSILFVNRNWFQHTVLNHYHWESWGEDDVAQGRRLYLDYMDAIAYVARRGCSMHDSMFTRLMAIVYEVNLYVGAIVGHMKSSHLVLPCKDRVFERRFAYRVAIFLAPVIFRYFCLRSFLVRPLKTLLCSLGFCAFNANS